MDMELHLFFVILNTLCFGAFAFWTGRDSEYVGHWYGAALALGLIVNFAAVVMNALWLVFH